MTPAASYSTDTYQLSFPESSRFIRLVVTGKDGGQDQTASVRVEFHGCRESSGAGRPSSDA